MNSTNWAQYTTLWYPWVNWKKSRTLAIDSSPEFSYFLNMMSGFDDIQEEVVWRFYHHTLSKAWLTSAEQYCFESKSLLICWTILWDRCVVECCFRKPSFETVWNYFIFPNSIFLIRSLSRILHSFGSRLIPWYKVTKLGSLAILDIIFIMDNWIGLASILFLK